MSLNSTPSDLILPAYCAAKFLVLKCARLFFREEVIHMSAYCEICQKGAMSGMNVSHSHLKTKRKWKPNIQRVRAVVDGKIQRVNVCTRCLRSGKIQRAI